MLKFCRTKPVQAALLAILLIFLPIYLAYGYYIGRITKDIMLSAFEQNYYVENNPYNDVISDEYYNWFVVKAMADYNRPNSYDKTHLSSPLVLHWFTGAEVWISYDYSFYVGKENMINLTNILVKFSYKLQNGDWQVMDCYVGPSSTGA